MRSRNIKPAFFKDENLAEVPIEARLLFIGMWSVADREGRLEDRPKRIRAEVFPYDNIDVVPLLDHLEKGKLITRYKAAGFSCIHIPSFKRDQNPHPNEKPSVLPAPGDIAKLHEDSITTREKEVSTHADIMIPDIRIPDSLNGNQRQVWEALATIQGFNPEPAWVEELMADFPSIDLADEIKRCRDYNRKKPTSNPNWKSRLRNWCGNAVKFQKRDAGPTLVASQKLDVPDWWKESAN